ncbi:endopeptidase La, partial [bacterium]
MKKEEVMATDDARLGQTNELLHEGIDPEHANIPEILPVLPIRDVVVFPYMILPLFVGREKSVLAVEEALKEGRMIFLNTQKDMAEENPSTKDLHEMGTVGLIMKMLRLPDGRVKALVQGLTRARRIEMVKTEPFMAARIETLPEVGAPAKDYESEALVRSVREKVEAVIEQGKGISTEIMMVLENIDDVGRLADIVAANLSLKIADAMLILSAHEPKERLGQVLALLDRELQVLEMQKKIKSAAKEEMSRSQREYYLRQQMKAIQDELGVEDEHSEEMDKLKKSIEKAKMSKEAREEALK